MQNKDGHGGWVVLLGQLLRASLQRRARVVDGINYQHARVTAHAFAKRAGRLIKPLPHFDKGMIVPALARPPSDWRITSLFMNFELHDDDWHLVHAERLANFRLERFCDE